MTKKVRKMANGGALSDIVGVAGGSNSVGGGGFGSGGFGGGGGGGSATEGLGQVNQGSQTIGSALQKAQAANTQAANAAQQANAAVGGGGSGGGSGDGTVGDLARDPAPPIAIQALNPGYTRDNSYKPFYDPGPMKKGGTVKKYAKGGRISLEHCGVSTHTPNKKSPSW
jgi:hypothetical protein